MKIKMNLYISSPEDFARGRYESAFATSMGRHMDDDWVFCQELDIDLKVSTDAVVKAASKELDADIGKHTAAINNLENRKAELLALPAPEEV